MIARAFAALLLGGVVAGSAAADSPKAPPLAPAAIRWADTFSDAVLEATERNVPIFLHSHCNT